MKCIVILQEEVMPGLVQFLSNTLSVSPLTQPILLDKYATYIIYNYNLANYVSK